MLTQSRLKELFFYDPETGRLLSKFTGNSAGIIGTDGYVNVWIDGDIRLAQYLIWLYVYGCIPDRVEHKNENKSDNRLCNLYDATK